MPPVDHLTLPAQRLLTATSFQEGIALLRPDFVAFLPTRGPTNIGGEVLKAAVGVSTIYKDGKWSFHAAAAQGPEAFDQAVAAAATAHGLLLRRGDGTERVGAIDGTARQVGGRGLILLRRGEDQVTLKAAPGQDLTGWLSAWPEGRPVWEGRKLATLFAALTAVPALFALICVVVAIVDDDWTVAFGGCFWGALVLFGWGGFFVAWRRAKQNGHVGA